MEINTSYLSDHNTYRTNNPEYIVVHNTDNFSEGADARAHAYAQFHGNLSGTSVHFYTDDKGIAYQTAELQRGCWHVGVNYGGKAVWDSEQPEFHWRGDVCTKGLRF